MPAPAHYPDSGPRVDFHGTRRVLRRSGQRQRWTELPPLAREVTGAILVERWLAANAAARDRSRGNADTSVGSHGSRLEAPENYAEPTPVRLDRTRASDYLASALGRTELASRAGFPTRPRHDDDDLLVLGAGPAGLTAAVCAGSEGQRTRIVEFHAAGGQAGVVVSDRELSRLPDGVSGAELADSAHRQAQRLGAEFLIGVLVLHARP